MSNRREFLKAAGAASILPMVNPSINLDGILVEQLDENWVEKLEQSQPCHDGLAFAQNYKTAQSAWDHCERADWMLWAWSRNVKQDSESHKRLVVVVCKIARRALKHTKDKRTKKLAKSAILAAEKWVTGEASLEEVRQAADAATDAADAAAWSARDAAAVYYAATDAAWSAANAAYAAYAAAGAANAAEAAATNAANAAANYGKTYYKELKDQADLIRKFEPKAPEFIKT